MNTRERATWVFAVAVSLSVHGALFWHNASVLSAQDGKSAKPSGVTRLSFSTLSKPQPAPVPEEKPKPKPEPKPKPKPKPKPEQKPKPAPKPEPKPEPVEEVAQEQEQPPPASQQPAGDARVAEQARQNYLGVLMAHIEKHKYYPRAARRRGLEGVVRVSFVLQRSGGVENLVVDEGHKMLRKAAEEAVKTALPLPVPPPAIPCPMDVSYGMEFRLK